MEKTIEIDGKEVRLKSTGAIPIRYKAQFGRDYFADLMKMYKLAKINTNKKELDDKDYEALTLVDFEVFYNLIWVMAKTADKSIPDPLTWLDGFEEFPIMEIIPQIQDLIEKNLKTTKKK